MQALSVKLLWIRVLCLSIYFYHEPCWPREMLPARLNARKVHSWLVIPCCMQGNAPDKTEHNCFEQKDFGVGFKQVSDPSLKGDGAQQRAVVVCTAGVETCETCYHRRSRKHIWSSINRDHEGVSTVDSEQATERLVFPTCLQRPDCAGHQEVVWRLLCLILSVALVFDSPILQIEQAEDII